MPCTWCNAPMLDSERENHIDQMAEVVQNFKRNKTSQCGKDTNPWVFRLIKYPSG